MKDTTDLSFSFSGAGWLFLYHFGVAKALRESGVATNENRYIGTSGGALVAGCLLLGLSPDDLRDTIVESAKATRDKPFPRAFQTRNLIYETCNKYVGEERFLEYKELLESKLTVCITRLPSCQSLRVSTFPTYEAFVNALVASCTATPIAGFPFKLDGQWVADGGIADQQPILDAGTVTVAPIYFSNSDIRPSTAVPVWWSVYPPEYPKTVELFDLGHQDGINWLNHMGFRLPPRRLAVLASSSISKSAPVAGSKNAGTIDSDDQEQVNGRPAMPVEEWASVPLSLGNISQAKQTRASLLFLGLIGEIFSGRSSPVDVFAHGLTLMALIIMRFVAYIVIYMEFVLRAVLAYWGTLFHGREAGHAQRQAKKMAEMLYKESVGDFVVLVKGTLGRVLLGRKWGSWLSERSLAARLMYFAL